VATTTALAPATLSEDLDRRMNLYPKALLAALAMAFLFVLASGNGSDTASGRVGGDFPAFYSAGTIVAEGNIDNLWDPATQAAAQDQLLGDEDGFIMFPYAPYVAAGRGADGLSRVRRHRRWAEHRPDAVPHRCDLAEPGR
jgi:hypothetical protein